MKKLFSLFVLFISIAIYAQVPQGISYQAIALSASGNPVVSAPVGIRLSILDNSATGTALYTETFLKTTNGQGLFNLVIGQGTATFGTFSGINWKTNSKFLKMELDVAGGTNYALIGTTQLLSVPYALAAKSLALQAGEGITLTSPNGTPYQLTVNDNGELSTPTSNQPSNSPTQLYLYGSFNSWNATTALEFNNYYQNFTGYKYFTSGTQIKFLAAQNSNVIYGGNSLNGELTLNGGPITIPANGFYKITVNNSGGLNLSYTITSINVELEQNYTTNSTMSYNVAGNYFYYTSNYGQIRFSVDNTTFGDNLADGIIEAGGAYINVTQGINHLFKLYLNFNTTGNYTVTP